MVNFKFQRSFQERSMRIFMYDLSNDGKILKIPKPIDFDSGHKFSIDNIPMTAWVEPTFKIGLVQPNSFIENILDFLEELTGKKFVELDKAQQDVAPKV